MDSSKNYQANDDALQTSLSTLYRYESRRIYATLVRLLNDFDLAEEPDSLGRSRPNLLE